MTEQTKQNLDGKTPVKPTPFDAHEQATRGEHLPTQADQAEPHAGEGKQYPKAVDHVQGSEPGQLEPVIVKSAEEEKAYLASKAPAAKTEAKPAVVETKIYSDGSSATGPAPLPELSPGQQDAQQAASRM